MSRGVVILIALVASAAAAFAVGWLGADNAMPVGTGLPDLPAETAAAAGESVPPSGMSLDRLPWTGGASATARPAAPPAPVWHMAGIVRRGTDHKVLVKIDTSPGAAPRLLELAVGDSLPDGRAIIKVLADAVYLRFGAQETYVNLFDGSK